MVIYADILLITNFIVDYFLLSITGNIIKQKPGILRSVLAALFASVGSLVIFLPEQNAILRFVFRLSFSFVICLIDFGYRSLKQLSLACIIFLAVTTSFAGSMLALFYIFKPSGMAINNSVVYFNISPVSLILFSVLGFLLFTALSYLLSKRAKTAQRCTVTLTFYGKKAAFNAVIDSGNSLADNFTQRAVIILDNKTVRKSFGSLTPSTYAERYRAVPCGTVSGSGILDGYRCESGAILTDNKTYKLIKPLMAISKTPLCDCEAIVNPLDCT